MESTNEYLKFSEEYDACGLFGRIEKSGVPSREVVWSGLQALDALKHRAGTVNGEGDGCGLMLDIPVALWRRWLTWAEVTPDVVEDKRFFVAHLFLDATRQDEHAGFVRHAFKDAGVDIVLERLNVVNPWALGPVASQDLQTFLQIAGLTPDTSELCLHRLTLLLEDHGIHVASMSRTTVVYKVVGDANTLWDYYPDLQDEQCASAFVLAHTRFSTNTATRISRVQPFSTLGHNGEINTIRRFQTECNMVGIAIPDGFSDSQMVNRGLHGLVAEYGLSLFESMELAFPPILHEIRQMPKSLADMYKTQRAIWGPFCQGPAAVMVRLGSEAVFSVDALGLRPLWYIETAAAHCFCSEQGLVGVEQWASDPRPLSPGEKWGVKWERDRVVLYDYEHLVHDVYTRWQQRYPTGLRERNRSGFIPRAQAQVLRKASEVPLLIRAAAHGWCHHHVRFLEDIARSGAEPIHSLGYDGPLAALSEGPRLLSDFLQESVAVVTNPAIDREREVEHFSTRVVIGRRPGLQSGEVNAPRLELKSPLLLETLPEHLQGTADEIQALAQRVGTVTYEDMLGTLHANPQSTAELQVFQCHDEDLQAALDRLSADAVDAALAGAHVIVLDDRGQFRRGRPVDPFLVASRVHTALLECTDSSGRESLRRHTSLIVRSGSIRSLHDIMVFVGLGADAVNPYLLWEMAADRGGLVGVENAYLALCKGIEKVISTLGIHELRGYERLFAAIGLKSEVSKVLNVPNFCGSSSAGYGFVDMEADAVQRQTFLETGSETLVNRRKEFRLYPRLWKAVGQVARREIDYRTYYERLLQHETDNPVNLKHGLKLRSPSDNVSDQAVDTTIDGHAYPFVISSMSFGSQGEIAYRAYAEAAYQMNIVALNGEGGEIKDIIDMYPRNRGRQVASGRFGVNAELCNGAYVLEIKIGQGAKPGEGGHLPGSKVTQLVANARNAAVGVDLISPSNNHDIYSIEDLAQVIHELREVNPNAKIAVKVPVVPNIGTIAVGIVKAGADIVNLSGFDGGTGAARAHAIQHVGLPVEIGIPLVHDALCEAGLRDCVEIWADGGMKSGTDVLKSILLGANRVGFGTMAMVAIGCTACRACQKDTCHVGIATQMTTEEEATAKGLPMFSPRSFTDAVSHLKQFFQAIGQHVQDLTRELGATRTQDLVGRRDLLIQTALRDKVDLTWLTTVSEHFVGKGCHVSFRQACSEEAVNDAFSELRLEMAVGGNPWTAQSHEASVQTPVRALGSRQSGDRVRKRQHTGAPIADLHPAVAGNGFAAYHTVGMYSVARGGAQDGVGKGAYGGRIVVLKERGSDGVWRGGSVGKGIGYGAQHGLLIVQGNADARAGVRLSGADLVIGGVVETPRTRSWGWTGASSNIKGFAFEYMTAGRALVMGDPGPWICSGMTGGSVYVRHDPNAGLSEEGLRRRIAKGAKVQVSVLDPQGERDVSELLLAYHKELRRSGQSDAAKALVRFILQPADHFRMIRPGEALTDQTIATE